MLFAKLTLDKNYVKFCIKTNKFWFNCDWQKNLNIYVILITKFIFDAYIFIIIDVWNDNKIDFNDFNNWESLSQNMFHDKNICRIDDNVRRINENILQIDNILNDARIYTFVFKILIKFIIERIFFFAIKHFKIKNDFWRNKINNIFIFIWIVEWKQFVINEIFRKIIIVNVIFF